MHHCLWLYNENLLESLFRGADFNFTFRDNRILRQNSRHPAFEAGPSISLVYCLSALLAGAGAPLSSCRRNPLRLRYALNSENLPRYQGPTFLKAVTLDGITPKFPRRI